MNSRQRSSLFGLFIGDALAMPVHWYYDRQALFQDYGEVADYLAPHNPHSGSILWRSRYSPVNPKGDILHDQARYWGQKGVHYHQFLRAGENTLNLQLCQQMLGDFEGYPRSYVDFMTQPGRHRDTYVEECHRNFFTNYARGVPLDQCGTTEHHIGGLPFMVPALLSGLGLERALKLMALTHPGPEMETAGRVFGELLLAVLGGADLAGEIRRQIALAQSPCWRWPYLDWLAMDDLRAVGPGGFSPACYVDEAFPATLYLALKYADRPEQGLIANANVGGDNAHRGAVLGALLGAANASWPQRWIDGLLAAPAIEAFCREPAAKSQP
jgi:ADP-ribosyl-[dinitrogen reductase] hydrolase